MVAAQNRLETGAVLVDRGVTVTVTDEDSPATVELVRF